MYLPFFAGVMGCHHAIADTRSPTSRLCGSSLVGILLAPTTLQFVFSVPGFPLDASPLFLCPCTDFLKKQHEPKDVAPSNDHVLLDL